MDQYKKKEFAVILSNEPLCDGIIRLVLKTEAAQTAVPGQFVNLYLSDGAHLLPRPISICGIDGEGGTLTLVFRVAGFGTGAFSKMKAGERIGLIGPLGNGFPLEMKEKKALFVGGGIGIPPMLALARQWQGEGTAVLGFRDEAFLTEEFSQSGIPVFLASDSGRVGTKGTVMDVIRGEGLSAEVAFACGPKPMLRAFAEWVKENGIQGYVSMEERMACGVGACLACVCESAHTDAHSKVHNKRVCKDGPVFDINEVVL